MFAHATTTPDTPWDREVGLVLLTMPPSSDTTLNAPASPSGVGINSVVQCCPTGEQAVLAHRATVPRVAQETPVSAPVRSPGDCTDRPPFPPVPAGRPLVLPGHAPCGKRRGIPEMWKQQHGLDRSGSLSASSRTSHSSTGRDSVRSTNSPLDGTSPTNGRRWANASPLHQVMHPRCTRSGQGQG
jgi:hypothetical protein